MSFSLPLLPLIPLPPRLERIPARAIRGVADADNIRHYGGYSRRRVVLQGFLRAETDTRHRRYLPALALVPIRSRITARSLNRSSTTDRTDFFSLVGVFISAVSISTRDFAIARPHRLGESSSW